MMTTDSISSDRSKKRKMDFEQEKECEDCLEYIQQFEKKIMNFEIIIFF